jgi:hypothetical protein
MKALNFKIKLLCLLQKRHKPYLSFNIHAIVELECKPGEGYTIYHHLTIFQLYRGSQFYWSRKPECPFNAFIITYLPSVSVSNEILPIKAHLLDWSNKTQCYYIPIVNSIQHQSIYTSHVLFITT